MEEKPQDEWSCSSCGFTWLTTRNRFSEGLQSKRYKERPNAPCGCGVVPYWNWPYYGDKKDETHKRFSYQNKLPIIEWNEYLPDKNERQEKLHRYYTALLKESFK